LKSLFYKIVVDDGEDGSSDISDRVRDINDSYDVSSLLYPPSVYDHSVHAATTRKLYSSPSKITI